jgi:hypothetical protein
VLLGWLLAVGAVLGLARTVVALPEQCPSITADRALLVSERAVGWFQANLQGNGRWLYRWDANRGEDVGGYNWVRHSGVLLSLEQAAAVGVPGAEAAADAGWPAALDRLIRRPGLAVIPEDDGTVFMGGTALLTVALGERFERGAPTDEGLLRDLGRALLGQIGEGGEVADRWDPTTGRAVEGSRSPFTPGEVAFALARLDRLLPGEGFGEPVSEVILNLSTVRASVDGFVPDASDHWAAYATAEMTAAGVPLPDWHVAWARRQLGIMGVQARYESQRTNGGIDRWLRGRQALPAGVGTIGEASSAWWEAAGAEPALARWQADISGTSRCVAGMLADRQVVEARPEEAGAWFQFGFTQMDDQQHALSAVLGALGPIAADGPLPAGENRRPGIPVPESWPLALVAMVAAVNPVRAARRRDAASPLSAVSLLAPLVVLVAFAVVGGWVTRQLGISGPTALVAASLVLAATSLVDLLRLGTGRQLTALHAMAEIARPAALVVALALGSGDRAVLAVGGGVLSVGVVAAWRAVRDDAEWGRWAEGLVAAVGVLAAVGLLIAGIYAA